MCVAKNFLNCNFSLSQVPSPKEPEQLGSKLAKRVERKVSMRNQSQRDESYKNMLYITGFAAGAAGAAGGKVGAAGAAGYGAKGGKAGKAAGVVGGGKGIAGAGR